MPSPSGSTQSRRLPEVCQRHIASRQSQISEYKEQARTSAKLSRSALALHLLDLERSRWARPQQLLLGKCRIEPVQPLRFVENHHLSIVDGSNVRPWLACEHRESRGGTFDRAP